METYGARESVIDGADSSCLAEQISTIIAKERVEHIKSTDKTIDCVIKHKDDFDYILFLGAGDIYDLKGKLTPYLT
jgi:UDP-N-acetylmuramate-alanine ligase